MQLFLIVMLTAVTLGAPCLAGNSVKESGKEIGQGFKKIGEDTGQAFKKGGKEVGQGFKSLGKETGKAFQEGGKEIGSAAKKRGRSMGVQKPGAFTEEVLQRPIAWIEIACIYVFQPLLQPNRLLTCRCPVVRHQLPL